MRNDVNPGASIKALREAAGLSQPLLAERSGVALRTLRSYEQGTRDLMDASLATVLRLAAALGCSVYDLAAVPDGTLATALATDGHRQNPTGI